MNAIRSFVAIELDGAVRRELARLQARLDRDAGGAVRWTADAHLHLTLKFLGDVDPGRLPEICGMLTAVAAAAEPFDLTIRGAGCFPPGGNVRVVFAGLEKPTGLLAALQAVCEASLASLGFPPERRAFRPHISIGRARQGRRAPMLRAALERHAAFECGIVAVDEIVLFQSVLGRDGPIHTPISRHSLGELPRD